VVQNSVIVRVQGHEMLNRQWFLRFVAHASYIA
jgi:hypothetical protein